MWGGMAYLRRVAQGPLSALLTVLLTAQLLSAAQMSAAHAASDQPILCAPGAAPPAAFAQTLARLEAALSGEEGGERAGPHCPDCVIGAIDLPQIPRPAPDPRVAQTLPRAVPDADLWALKASYLAAQGRAPPLSDAA